MQISDVVYRMCVAVGYVVFPLPLSPFASRIAYIWAALAVAVGESERGFVSRNDFSTFCHGGAKSCSTFLRVAAAFVKMRKSGGSVAQSSPSLMRFEEGHQRLDTAKRTRDGSEAFRCFSFEKKRASKRTRPAVEKTDMRDSLSPPIESGFPATSSAVRELLADWRHTVEAPDPVLVVNVRLD